MKKFLTWCCVAAAMSAGMTSCEEPETGYEGTNYIYLESASSSMYDNASLEISVVLTTALDQDLTLTLKTDDTEGIITLEGNPVTIPAGERSGAVTVKSAELSENSMNFRISLDESTVLPENVKWDKDFTFTVNSSAVPELTDDQLAIIEAYKTATGIDLSKYLGLVKVSTVYTASSQDSDIPLPAVTLTGITAITLSEESTADQPVLKMTDNPMGLQETLYSKLKANTIDNPYWAESVAEDAPSYTQLLKAIDWTSDSDETFTASVDGIRPKADGTVEFVADLSYFDEEYEEDVTMFKVPFEFAFSAYDREKAALEAGTIGTEANPDWLYDATVDPDFYLNIEDVSEDYYECGNWTASSAEISAEKMTFTFCIYNYSEYDYSKVVATYTPNE